MPSMMLHEVYVVYAEGLRYIVGISAAVHNIPPVSSMLEGQVCGAEDALA